MSMKQSASKLTNIKSRSLAPKLKFSVNYSYEDYYSLFSTFYNHSNRRDIYQIFYWLLGIVLIVISINGFYKDPQFNARGTIIGLILLVPQIYYLKLYSFIYFHIKKNFTPDNYIIDEYGVRITSRRLLRENLKWSSIYKFIVIDDQVLLVSRKILFPSVLSVVQIQKKFIKNNEWIKLISYINNREEILANSKQPNKILRWSIRIIFIILLELCLLCAYMTFSLIFQVLAYELYVIALVLLLAVYIPYYSLLIDYRRFSLSKNLLFPLGALVLFNLLFIGVSFLSK